jgi:hypothetical protein
VRPRRVPAAGRRPRARGVPPAGVDQSSRRSLVRCANNPRAWPLLARRRVGERPAGDMRRGGRAPVARTDVAADHLSIPGGCSAPGCPEPCPRGAPTRGRLPSRTRRARTVEVTDAGGRPGNLRWTHPRRKANRLSPRSFAGDRMPKEVAI